MKIFAKTSSKPNYLFGLLPSRFVEEDTYKPNAVSGYTEEGLLERFLEILCLEVDNELSPYIDGVGLLVDASSLSSLPHDDPDKFIIHLAEDLGNPPDIGSADEYKVLLTNIRLINQHKGTKTGLELFLAVFRYKISNLVESSVTQKTYDSSPAVEYDSDGEYDFGFVFYSGYNVEITDMAGTGPKNPSADFLLLLKEAIQKYISPVFATLNELTYV